MIRLLTSCFLCLAVLAAAAQARPLIASSEETAARLCHAFDDSPERLEALCAQALADGVATSAERAALLTLRGDALDLLGRDAEAEAAFRAAAEADPGHLRAYTGLGWLLWRQDREAEAVPYFRKAVDLRPTADGLAGLGSALYRARQAEPAAALELIAAALAIAPDYAWALRERGWIELDEGRPEAALATFDAALARDGDDWNAHYGRSRALAETGAYEAALEAVGRAIAVDGDQHWAYAHRAYVLRRLDRNAQAVTEAARAVALDPDWPGGHVQKALAEEALGRRAQALETFAAALRRGVESAYLLHWYADVLSNDGRMQEAAAMIDRAVARADHDQFDLSLKSWIAVELRDYGTALEAAEGALALDPSMPYPHYYAAVALVNRGRADDGLARFDEAMALGIDRAMIGVFAADLIAAGRFVDAIRLRARY
ncbi:tetratricopeptide repeat protein [Rhodobacteraceae bacterium 2CG4]|uniref:Tetratricopeptide repeat protein n=1 Tax=Halovulum marinum TaxID=2662447 RepID=A0A6L5Z5W6_9RHOB|nr:tetratricopeptide repeat protein [Halovulum marinum]MSU91976.1 tetratricopeptide repeat protein [Halovulum marinum]